MLPHARDLVHCGNPAVRVAHERFRLEERELVALLLREGHRAGELEVKKIDVTAATVLRAYASFSPPWIFLEPAEDVLKALRSMHDLVLKGLVRRTG